MRVDFRIGWAVTLLILVACSERAPPRHHDEPDSSGDEPRGSGGESPGLGGAGGEAPLGFQPVPRKQPTESGPWVVDPSDPLTLYALGQRSMRSRDGGHTWDELDWPADARALAFTQLPVPALYLLGSDPWLESPDRLLESLDGGDSWSDTKAVLPSSDWVVVDQQDGPVLVALRDGTPVRSTDKGVTWVASVLPAALPGSPMPLYFESGGARLQVSSGPNPVVYFATLVFDSTFESLVFVSTDGGATFVAKSVPGDAETTPPPLSLDCRGRLYIMVGTTVYRSSDVGTSWQSLVDLGAGTQSFAVVPGVPGACGDSVYADGVVDGAFMLWRLDDSSVANRGRIPWGQMADLGEDRLLLIPSSGARLRSDDGGRTWWTAGINLDGALFVSPAGAGSLLVRTQDGSYLSEDKGATWQWRTDKPTWPGVSDLYPDPFDVNVLYGRSIYGEDSPWSFISKDRGVSFQNWPVPSADAPEMPEAIAATAPGGLTIVTEAGAYTTQDAGGHFTPLLTISSTSTGPFRRQIMWAGIGSSDPPGIYTYVGGDDRADEMLISIDGGANWASRDPSTYTTDLVVSPVDPRVAFGAPGYSGDQYGALRTLDGGITWQRIAVPGETYVRLQFDPQPPHALYAIGKRLSRSEDDGDSWRFLSQIPANAGAVAFAPSADKTRYVLGRSGLLYKMIE